ncbi:MAG: Fumarate hydratase class II, partial [uncultured Thermomicrobiales bacterium]
DGRGDASRARLAGGIAGAGQRLLWRPDDARQGKLSDQRSALPAPLHPRDGADQGGGGAGQSRTRPARPPDRRGDRRGGARGRRWETRRRICPRHLPDRLRHLDQYERQRGPRLTRQRDPRRRARREEPGPPERSRQHGAIVERRDPDRDPPRRPRRDLRGPDARARPPRRGAVAQGAGVHADHQDRAHPPPGRDADPTRPGVRGLRRPDRARAAATGICGRRTARGRARRHRRRHRDQHPPPVRGAGLRPGQPGGGLRDCRDDQPLPGAEHPRWRRRRQRRAEDDRRQPAEDRQRHPLARLRPARRDRGTRPPGGPARLVDHARQGQPGDRRVGGDGRGAGAGQRRDDQHRRELGQLRAERDDADRLVQLAAVDRHPRHRLRQLRSAVHRGLAGDRARPADGRAGLDGRHRARAADRLRRRRQYRQAGRQERSHDPRGGARADRPHRGRVDRSPRPGQHDRARHHPRPGGRL